MKMCKEELLTYDLGRSPFQVHKDVYRAFTETNRYFTELLEIKKKQLYLGESDKGTSTYL